MIAANFNWHVDKVQQYGYVFVTPAALRLPGVWSQVLSGEFRPGLRILSIGECLPQVLQDALVQGFTRGVGPGQVRRPRPPRVSEGSLLKAA